MSGGDPKGPVWRRPQDRDVYTPKHSAAPEFVAEDPTGKYEGEELQRIRSRRPTPERISRLELKHDRLAEVVTDVRVDVKTLLVLAEESKAERERRIKMENEAQTLALAKRKTWPPIIKAIGAALALIIAALVGKGAL
jgi:hypothetical protein